MEDLKLKYLKEQFDIARKSYPGVRRGLQTEWDNFFKKNKNDYYDIIPLLQNAIHEYIQYIDFRRENGFKDLQYCSFSVWINQRRWELEYPELSQDNNSKKIDDPASLRDQILK